MTRLRVTLIAAAIINLPIFAVAQSLPTYDIERDCRSWGSHCNNAEVTSRNALLNDNEWQTASPDLRQRCIAWNQRFFTKYAPSETAEMRYVNLEDCILHQGPQTKD
jgi:hypothetical protein